MFHRLGVLIGHVSDTPSQTRIAVLLGIPAFGLMEFAFHIGLARLGASPVIDAAIDAALTGIFFGLVLWSFLTAISERRKRVRQDLERIAELNHEIRNALEIIAHSHFAAEARHRAMVLESVSRIDVVLKRVFPARMRF
jgi:hypothetical protein